MPKLKIKGAVKKRMTLTATGKIKRKRSGHSHILTKKSPKRKRRLRSVALVSPHHEKRMKTLLGK